MTSRHLQPRILADERGVALISAIMIMSIILVLGGFAIISSRSEIRTSTNYKGRIQAQYFAESAIDELVGRQNDMTQSPRYLFNSANYTSVSSDSSVFPDRDAVDPQTGAVVGTIHRVILGKNPVSDPPPYRIRTTATLDDGSLASYEVEVDATSLLDFAVYGEATLKYCPPSVTYGRTYSAADIEILTSGCSPYEVFMKKVEYVGSVINGSNADFREGAFRVEAYPPLTTLVNLGYYENAAKNAGVCGTSKRGIYIGNGASVPAAVKTQSTNLFGLNDAGTPGVDNLTNATDWTNAATSGVGVTGCRTLSASTPACYQVDLTLFDFTASPITYGGVPVIGYDGANLTPSTFNGVIFVDGELHVWGILGGRSTEDRVVVDSVTTLDSSLPLQRPTGYAFGEPTLSNVSSGAPPRGKPFYHHPKFGNLGAPYNTWVANRYSNNQLDTGEDANANGELDPLQKGRNVTIVTGELYDIVIDHNIFVGEDPNGRRVSLGLVAGDVIYIDANSPRVTVNYAAKLGRGDDNLVTWFGSFIANPTVGNTSHRRNYWAKSTAASTDSIYVFDMDADGTIETDVGLGLSGDRNENAMKDAWKALDVGNIVTHSSQSYGAWATEGHGSFQHYDFELVESEPPCYPIMPKYGTVPGSWTELRY